MAPPYRAAVIFGTALALAPLALARWRADVRQDLMPPAPSHPVFVAELIPPQAVEVVLPESSGSNAQGTVSVSFCVTREGKVTHVAVVRSLSEEADELAREAVRSWRFIPAKRGDRAESARVEVTFTLTADQILVSARSAGKDLALPPVARNTRSRRPDAALVDREASMLPSPWLSNGR